MDNMQLIVTKNLEDPKVVRTTEPSKYEAFVERAQNIKAKQASDPVVSTLSWADPDPEAASKLPAARHPLTAMLNNRRGTKGTAQGRRNNIRWICATIQGVTPMSLTWEQVMNYPWHQVDADLAAQYYRKIVAIYPHIVSRKGRIVMLRAITHACFRAKLISAARRSEVFQELPTEVGVTKFRGVRLTDDQIESLLEECAKGDARKAARNSAVVAVFSTTGVRVSELVGFDLSDWDQDGGMLHLRVTKNGKPHVVPVHPVTHEYLVKWIEFRGEKPGPLFLNLDRKNSIRTTEKGICRMVQRKAKACGIGSIGTHDFRRSVASKLLRKHDVALVARLLNHSSIQATLVYDLATVDEQRNAIAGLVIPSPSDDVGPAL